MKTSVIDRKGDRITLFMKGGFLITGNVISENLNNLNIEKATVKREKMDIPPLTLLMVDKESIVACTLSEKKE